MQRRKSPQHPVDNIPLIGADELDEREDTSTKAFGGGGGGGGNNNNTNTNHSNNRQPPTSGGGYVNLNNIEADSYNGVAQYEDEVEEIDDFGFEEPPNLQNFKNMLANKNNPNYMISLQNNNNTHFNEAENSNKSHSLPAEGLQLSNYPWLSWLGCVIVALLPWGLVFAFPLTKALWIFTGLFFVLAVCLAACCDWVKVDINPDSSIFTLTKSSVYRWISNKTINERFALEDIKRVRVMWLGEAEMRRHMHAGHRPCCHSHRTAIQASTILVLTVSGSSAFQSHNSRIARRAAPAIADLAGSDITSASRGYLNITVREVQDLLGLERFAVKSLEDWAAQINNALNLESLAFTPQNP